MYELFSGKQSWHREKGEIYSQMIIEQMKKQQELYFELNDAIVLEGEGLVGVRDSKVEDVIAKCLLFDYTHRPTALQLRQDIELLIKDY